MATGTKTRSKTKAKPAPEPEVDETEDDELEELEEDEVEEAPPAKAASKRPEITFGVADLAKHLTEQGHKVDTRGLRTLIRKMARDESGRVTREIVAGNRTRYDWPKGIKDPEVKAIIKAFEAGELEADKKEKLDALKERKAAKDKEAADNGEVVKPKRGKKAKPAPEPVVEEDDDDEDLELEDDDE